MTTTKFSSVVICAFLALVTFAVETSADDIFFRTRFEYAGGEPTIGQDAANLNGANGQIGTFSGAIPFGNGNAHPDDPELMGFVTHGGPNQSSRLLLIDRPIADGVFSANLAKPAPVDGTKVSFEVGTRRSAGDIAVAREKDYDIIGYDAGGNESFHLRVSAHSGDLTGEVMRLGVVSDNGGTVTWDLPTVIGDDADLDLDSTGGSFNRGHVAVVDLALRSDGFVVDFENFSTRNTPNSYTTAILPYNGSATELTRIEFTLPGDITDPNNTSVQGGYVLDNIIVSVPEPGSVVLGLIAAAGLFVGRRRWVARV